MPNHTPGLDDRVVLVTGATSGIGAVIAADLIAAGWRVIVAGRSVTRGEALVARLGPRARFVAADLSEPDAGRQLVADAAAQFGRLDALVNNAAIDHTNDLLDVEEVEIEATFRVNSVAAITVAIAAARVMRDQGEGGAIVNLTSRLASIGVPTMGIYSASKGAMLAFTTAAAVELAPHRIRVNAVAPGMTRTPLYDSWLAELDDPAAEAERVAAAIPLGRIAEPADVSAAVRFLISPEAEYITGTSLPVDGGYLAK